MQIGAAPRVRPSAPAERRRMAYPRRAISRAPGGMRGFRSMSLSQAAGMTATRSWAAGTGLTDHGTSTPSITTLTGGRASCRWESEVFRPIGIHLVRMLVTCSFCSAVSARVPLSGTVSGEIIGGGPRYQRHQRRQEHLELLDLADGDDAEHDHGHQGDHQECQQGDELVCDAAERPVFQRLWIIAIATPRGRNVVRVLLRRPVRIRLFSSALWLARSGA